MSHLPLPNLVLQNIFNQFLDCYDQLFFSKLFCNQLTINDRSLAMRLRRSHPVDIRQFFIQSLSCYDQYSIIGEEMASQNSTGSYPVTLERAFDVDTFNRTWGYSSTNLFHLYSRLFSFSPFFYRPQYPLVDIFKVSCKLDKRKSTKHATHEKTWSKLDLVSRNVLVWSRTFIQTF